ncbi:hypothetical protein BDV26DRAFT_223693 [Aspergillus bertholletiae]|uniref:G-protein coupled receptors family 2 profile 2 domain-containing protein n=1 Tax=Aspergillus bertholletiae TaxID=1226010 RepID=A0A5N7BLN7_9EURO|nr:hypothetical protein BDV26DRAFT_223693 [Aspergillus bertholletiae]
MMVSHPMTNTTMQGLCPEPFLQESFFPSTGGFIEGRYCAKIPLGDESLSCCMPCPLADWMYGEDITSKTQAASWLSVGILPLCIFLLVSYAVLPAKWTHRHYLSICFTLAICCMELAFIIPLGAKPDQCYNQITPNDMYSNLSCAWSGTLLLFGGWGVVSFSLIRTLAFHLQVCWEVILGNKFMWGAFICGWGIPGIGITVMLLLTGVSFRFGNVCHINVKYGTQDYWAPIMAFAGASLVLQFATLVYCIHVYVKSIFDTSDSTTNSSGLPSYTSSVRTVTARHAYRRIRRVLQLQWRGVALVLIIIANVIFFAVVFIRINNQTSITAENLERAQPWLLCLVSTQGDVKKCQSQAKAVGPNEAIILALMILLSLVGFWNFILFARPGMFLGWAEFFKTKLGRNHEFVSADARVHTPDTRTYEMLGSAALASCKSPEPIVRAPSVARTMSPEGNHYGREARYVRPSMSFSSPRPPSASQGRDWDPQATFAPATGHQHRPSQ